MFNNKWLGYLLKEAPNTLSGDVIEREEQQDILSEDQQNLILDYTKQFVKDDLMNIINYCCSWDEEFKHILPEDLVFKVLGLMNEGRRKCYTKTYRHFRSSVYYHVKNEMLTLFRYRKKEEIAEETPENTLTCIEAGEFFDQGNYTDGAEDVLTVFQKDDVREHLLRLFDPNKHIEEILVLELIFLGYKREDMAAELQLTVSEVTNIQKRVIRTLKKHNIKKLLEG